MTGLDPVVRTIRRDAQSRRCAVGECAVHIHAVVNRRASAGLFCVDALAADPCRAAAGQPDITHDSAVGPPVVPGLRRAAGAETWNRGDARPIVDPYHQQIAGAQLRRAIERIRGESAFVAAEFNTVEPYPGFVERG